ncbi:hypothetical protein SB783_05130 [Paraburkholderia sp. SIMBA_009]|uniref:Uncharacterized protein n=1 Tax=Paraburkholderia tropica TaxID=92647 RepID=A0ABX5MU62_9BURK|nr:hypothetical protein [Paraburkholderia tropica]PXX15838.1 hypothetical protein C7400_109173 [Paraburkholderia tropica]PZW82097.1 hypothetical protein C7399_109173 [Paraburkholderia tropica]
MKSILKTAFATVALLVSASAFSNCVGGPNLETCNDSNGNSYTVNRMGSMTSMNGYNAQTGSTWNQTSNTYGNTTQINGNAANGAHWNETIQNYGNGNRSIYGTDSRGNAYSHYCTSYGCN